MRALGADNGLRTMRMPQWFPVAPATPGAAMPLPSAGSSTSVTSNL